MSRFAIGAVKLSCLAYLGIEARVETGKRIQVAAGEIDAQVRHTLDGIRFDGIPQVQVLQTQIRPALHIPVARIIYPGAVHAGIEVRWVVRRPGL